jgi:virginiamycin B lyase
MMAIPSRRTAWALALALAAMGALAGSARAQIIDTYQVSTENPNSGPTATATAPDGTVWFVEPNSGKFGFVDSLRSSVTELALSLPYSQPNAIAVDPRSGAVCFCEAGTDRIGVYSPATGYLVEYSWGVSGVGLAGIAVDAQGRIWFTENQTNRIGLLDTNALTVQYFFWTTEDVGPVGIAVDPFGRAWFTENRANRIGYVDPTGNFVYDYYYTAPSSGPWGITVDADGDVWFAERNAGTVSMLDTGTGDLFQFDSLGGFGSQPMDVATQPNAQGQIAVAWGETAAGQVDLLNANTGSQTQIQASSPAAAPTGVTFAPTDNSLWFTDANTSDLQGYYYNPANIVRRLPAAGDPLLALFPPGARQLAVPPARKADPPRLEEAVRSAADAVRIVLVKAGGKGSHGHKKKTTVQKKPVQKGRPMTVSKSSPVQPAKHPHPVTKKPRQV